MEEGGGKHDISRAFEGGRALRQSDQNWAWRSQRVAVSWARATFRRGKDTKRVSMSKASGLFCK